MPTYIQHGQKMINHIQEQLIVYLYFLILLQWLCVIIIWAEEVIFTFVFRLQPENWGSTDLHPKIDLPFLVVMLSKSLHFNCSQFFTNKNIEPMPQLGP